jgi:hypothetical protein
MTHVAHALSYNVAQDIDHLNQSHGLRADRLLQVFDENGTASFFVTIEQLHRWLHEVDWYRF